MTKQRSGFQNREGYTGNAFQPSVPERLCSAGHQYGMGKEAVFKGAHHLGARRVKQFTEDFAQYNHCLEGGEAAEEEFWSTIYRHIWVVLPRATKMFM